MDRFIALPLLFSWTRQAKIHPYFITCQDNIGVCWLVADFSATVSQRISYFLRKGGKASHGNTRRRKIQVAVRKPGLTATELAKRFGMTQPAVSYAAIRGEQIVKERNYNLVS